VHVCQLPTDTAAMLPCTAAGTAVAPWVVEPQQTSVASVRTAQAW
jgi:hypothetical protein